MTLFDRDTLLREIASFFADRDGDTRGEIVRRVEEEVDRGGVAALVRLGRRLSTAGDDWDYYAADPLARNIHLSLAHVLLDPLSGLEGLDHLRAVSNGPVVIFANHLSYADANIVEVLLRWAGGEELADRLTVIAGPKVYSSLRRRFSSLCFGTIKTPQSSAVSSEDAVMNPREVARVARRCIHIAHDRVRAGDVLLVFIEGTRSRTFGMQQALAGASRYLEVPGTHVIPAAITGSEAMFPIDDHRLHTVRVGVRLGPAMAADDLLARSNGDRRVVVDAVASAIAELLPPQYRGVYDGNPTRVA
jgi:1-acyl-sn-glycerol-3-phosphate acyltransferase